MWIDGVVDVDFEDSGLSNVTVVWLFDEFNSADMIFSLDSNLDGVISASENEAIHDQAFSHLSRADYFLVAFAGTRRVEIPDATRFSASIVDGRLRYEFDVPLRLEWGEVDDVVFGLFDSSYYIDFVTDPARTSLARSGRTVHLSDDTLTLESEGWGRIQVAAVKMGLQ
jgi:ABC-type uncharacterized transport system substrate-binding protein